MNGYSRRLFLQLSGVATVGTLIRPHSAHAEDDPFALLRRRWRDVTAGSGFDAAAEPYRTRLAELGTAAAGYRDAMAPAGASLWPDLAFPSFTATPARLRTMARAYALPGTTVDPYRLPGTTVSTRRLADGAGEEWGDTCPPGRWVGGATDGTYATVGQHLNGFESTMEAFKSWFFLDDAVVCLGAAITGEDGVPVETVVDNRRTDAFLTVDDRAGWAHLEGHGGYVVPCARLHTLREERTGGPEPVTRSYVTLWLDHGVDPGSAGYVYLLLPGASLARTRARAADPGWARVLANTARRQGVRIPSLGITAVNFWNDGAAGGLTASAPCAVLVRELGDGTATLTVSDPRRDLDGLTVTWDRPVTEVLRGHPLLTGAATGARLTLAFGRLS
ncbi:polysaccharide lyase family 8 super-sandwich domain-containing protein, partial [Streptosporangium canum]|uniref:polysaccharide lyase family 8 super-sandwich domain-containing protein n=1 Tax=Streptosporangium canum TaxID=324952 RepID=UPI003439638B